MAITVQDFCMKKTDIGELVVIRDGGYISSCAWIDEEDLFALPERIRNKEVKKDEWGTIKLVDGRSYRYLAPCHYIDI